MNLKASISVTSSNINQLQSCLAVEIPAMQTKRSSVKLKKTKNTITFNITSKDPVALRATLHGITKLLTVFEKGQ